MKKNTQRIIAGLLVFFMIASLVAGVAIGASTGDSAPSPTQTTQQAV